MKVAQDTTDVPTNTAQTGLFKIGAQADASSGFWDGQIDEVRVIARALTQAEIQDLMDPDEVYSQTEQTVSTKYYFAGGRLAMRTNGTLHYLLSDHLGSTSITADANGDFVSEMCYMPWGETRYVSGTVGTEYLYTGQRRDAYIKLMWYGSRWYDPALGRFISADTIVPEVGNPIALDRYAYAANNPLKFVDPSGHCWGIASFIRGLPSYSTTCENLDMAAEIIKSEETTLGEKVLAGGYIVAEGTAHAALAVGTTALACSAAAPCATAVETALGIGTSAKGTHEVYQYVEASVVKYIGQTKDFARRAGEHFRDRGLRIEPIQGLEQLSKSDARAAEQVLIEYHGIENLYNKINSIAPSNPIYQDAIQRGTDLLKQVGIYVE